MHYKIAMVGQKGGVGKSTLARIIAVEATKGGLQAKIADMDTQQSTSVNWAARRAEKGVEPQIRVEPFRSVDTALKDAEGFDLYIFDGAPHSSQETRRACQVSDMVIIPTSEGLDDLHPSVILANNLLKEGNAPEKIAPGYPFNRTHPGLQFSRGGSLEGDPGSAGARAPRAAWATPPGAAWWR